MKFAKSIKVCTDKNDVYNNAFCLLFNCRMREESNHIKFTKRKRKDKNHCESMLQKNAPIGIGTYVLCRRPSKPMVQTKRTDRDNMLFCNKSGSYTASNIQIAEGNVQHIKFNIQEEKEKARILWTRVKVNCSNNAFYVLPVWIRPGQKVGIIFIDCMHIPGTRVCDLRDLSLDFVSKTRTFLHKRHRGHVLRRPNTFNLEIAVVDAPIDVDIIEPPTIDHFHYCCVACVRPVNQTESERYLHLYQNGKRCFHSCTPLGLSLSQQRSMQEVYQQECANGTSRWSGTCKFI